MDLLGVYEVMTLAVTPVCGLTYTPTGAVAEGLLLVPSPRDDTCPRVPPMGGRDWYTCSLGLSFAQGCRRTDDPRRVTKSTSKLSKLTV